MKLCPKCMWKQRPEKAVYCTVCGTMLVESNPICAQCGADLAANDLYCGACGHKVEKSATEK